MHQKMEKSGADFVPVESPEAGGGVVLIEIDENDAASDPPSPPPQSPFSEICRALSFGLLSASPTLLLIWLGARTTIMATCGYYLGLLLTAFLGHYCRTRHAVVRWILGVVMLSAMSSFKSARLLASCDDILVKGVLYAITVLWECSNAVLMVGGDKLLGRYDIDPDGRREILLYASAPCQVKFAPADGVSIHTAGRSPCGKSGRRSAHIALCALGVAGGYSFLTKVETMQTVVTSFVLFELEYIFVMASMAVILLDIPSHLWQIIQDILASTPLFASHATVPQAILPYGCVYSAKSTRDFWSRWSRPATQLIRHLLYYPLGGRERWYLSIPIMFILNASSHFDLSYALVGDRAEASWLALFGTLAVAAMAEVAGDEFFSVVEDDGSPSFPSRYAVARGFVAHASLRAALFIMVHKCLQTSLGDILASSA